MNKFGVHQARCYEPIRARNQEFPIAMHVFSQTLKNSTKSIQIPFLAILLATSSLTTTRGLATPPQAGNSVIPNRSGHPTHDQTVPDLGPHAYLPPRITHLKNTRSIELQNASNNRISIPIQMAAGQFRRLTNQLTSFRLSLKPSIVFNSFHQAQIWWVIQSDVKGLDESSPSDLTRIASVVDVKPASEPANAQAQPQTALTIIGLRKANTDSPSKRNDHEIPLNDSPERIRHFIFQPKKSAESTLARRPFDSLAIRANIERSEPLIGSAPFIFTIEESYLSYDLNENDRLGPVAHLHAPVLSPAPSLKEKPSSIALTNEVDSNELWQAFDQLLSSEPIQEEANDKKKVSSKRGHRSRIPMLNNWKILVLEPLPLSTEQNFNRLGALIASASIAGVIGMEDLENKIRQQLNWPISQSNHDPGPSKTGFQLLTRAGVELGAQPKSIVSYLLSKQNESRLATLESHRKH